MKLAEKLDSLLYKVTNPGRYIGNEWNAIIKDWEGVDIKIALAFPDIYEIGMSHLGIKLLYHLLNREGDILCERVFAPWIDMEELMRSEGIPLFSLENKKPVRDFDILGFTLQYEMSYTNILNMLDLGGLPLYSKDRNEEFPLVIAGGSTVFNPEPLAPFIDLFFIGEAEDGIVELVRKYDNYKRSGYTRNEILLKLSEIPGVYVPELYEIIYGENGQIREIKTKEEGIKKSIKRQVIKNLDEAYYPTDFIVPYHEIVHDRAVLEIARGCTRGCRFCAAGISYRPVRERKKETLIKLADQILASTGYEELSLTSLSTVDYSEVADLVKTLSRRYEDKKISISLPSLRVDRFSVQLAREVQRVRKSGLTFAPEAGTQRLRDVINKGVNEEDLYDAVQAAFEEGWSTVKLYFMIGLPTETEEDLEGIVQLARKVLEIGRSIRKQSEQRMKAIQIHVSVSTFVPKPFTPFQWVRMDNREEMVKKQEYLRQNLKGRGLSLSWNDPDLSLLEGAFSRGDRRLAPVLETAWRKGCRFEGWNDFFRFDKWKEAFKQHGLTIEEYLVARAPEQVLPWEHINMGVSKDFLLNEYQKAISGKQTSDCRSSGCTGCDICFELGARLELVGGVTNVDQG